MFKSFLTFFLFLLLFSPAFAQNSWPDGSKLEGLRLVQRVENIHVYTSENAQMDSLSLAYLLDAKSYFDGLFGLDFPVAILFVSNAEWNSYAYYPPPGMPQAWAGNIFLGSDKSIVAMQAEQQLKNLPQAQLAELQSHFGEPLNLDLFYRHNVAIHELGHLYQFYEGFRGQRRWLQEVFATWAARAYQLQYQPKLAAATVAYARIGSGLHFPQIKHTSLDDFEALYLNGLGPQNYEWYQFQLFKKVVQLHEKFGEKGLIDLREFLVQTDVRTTEKMEDLLLRKTLEEKLGEEMTEWLLIWEF
ncbi:hypothetical protein [Algoriphagus sp. CAU 1675]|uniref:hypothetical protein n=1 Tax=Algoriphagus sp. CAU 1675 TaxID=3032597 RepID=UPI0023DBE276|nr:hypothetical protein [Algoriphagus sp. CAU 1675]MDF2156475.1 hypothetical protein [Algoriphagus sp. CAU 1675]